MMNPTSPKGVMPYAPDTLTDESGDKPDLERKNGFMVGVGPVSVGNLQDMKVSKPPATSAPQDLGADNSKSVHHRIPAQVPRARLMARYDQFLMAGQELLKTINNEKASVALATVTSFIDDRINANGRYAIALPASLAQAFIDARNAGTDALRALRGSDPEATMGDASKTAMTKAIHGLLNHAETIYRPPTLMEALENPEQRAKLSELCGKMFQLENFNFLDKMREVRSPATSLPMRMEAYKAMYPRFISAEGEESINIASDLRKEITQRLEMLEKAIDAGDSEAEISEAMQQVDAAMQVAVAEIVKMLKEQGSTSNFLNALPRKLDL